ncbi:MAG: hypothetical protein GXY51_02655 [Bacteroidetes bacterium]|nr:hypothetical protein [Bacteroidota bacterium]
MEVKEAIKWFEWADDVYYCSMPDVKPDNDFYKQSRAISNLLKSLEAENKKLKKENKALRKDKWELEGINEACRKENEAYRGMWERISKLAKLNNKYHIDGYTTGLETPEDWVKTIKGLELKYLGGGE